jgi:CBS domain containing-hemolysin-like protein
MFDLIGAVLLVLTSSAVCSGTEAALFSIPLIKARQLAESEVSGSKALLDVRENMGRPIATIVVLNNVANIVGSILVGSIAARVLGDEWLGLFSAVLTFMVIIFAEIVPKTYGEHHNEVIGLRVARPLLGLVWVLMPLVWLIEQLTPQRDVDQEEPTTNEAEIRMLTRIARLEGAIEGDEGEMIQRVFAMNDRLAQDIMTPRVNITWLPGEARLETVQAEVLSSQHSRMVVIGETVDEVRGIVLRAELLKGLVENRGNETVATFQRPPRFVPQDARADRLLEAFRSARDHLMIVADDYGGVAGVVSLEDVLEVLTGEIVDETDTVADLAEEARQNREYSIEEL